MGTHVRSLKFGQRVGGLAGWQCELCEWCKGRRREICVREPGTGKTVTLKIFIEKWRDKAEIALIMTPRLSPEEFLVAVLEDLNIKLQNTTNKNELLKTFRDFLIGHSLSGKKGDNNCR